MRRDRIYVNRVAPPELEPYLNGLKELTRAWVINQVRQEMGVDHLLDLDRDQMARAKELIQHHRKIAEEKIAADLRKYEELKRKGEIS